MIFLHDFSPIILLYSTRPAKPRLRINSEDFMCVDDVPPSIQNQSNNTDDNNSAKNELLDQIALLTDPENISTV